MATWQELLEVRRPWVIAHRGDSAHYPENTLAAFEGAILAGADVVELDVVLTGDGVPVVLHDERVDRTTDGLGLAGYMAAETVTALDAGSWFDPRFAGERVPTLARVFEQIGDRVVLMVELRPSAFTEEEDQPHLELLVLDLIREHGLERSVLLSSFEPRFFVRLERVARDLPVVLLCDQGACETDVLALGQRLGAMAVGPDVDLVDQVDLLRLKTQGLRVLPWTVNHQAEMRRLLEWGADGLVTDDPALLGGVVRSVVRDESATEESPLEA